MHRAFVRMARDRAGSVAVMTALFMVVILGIAAIAVDLGTMFTDRRRAQGTADLAALAAVSDLTNAASAAAATIERNKYAKAALQSVEFGIYSADAALAAHQRFTPSASSSANAARVTMRVATPLYLGSVLTGTKEFQVETTAVATRSAFASIAIGSRLLKVDGGLLNQFLSGLLDTSLSLTVMDYQALVDAQLDLFNFADAVATRLSLTGITYDSLLASSVKVGDIVSAMVDTEKAAYGANHTAVRALSDIAQGVRSSTDKVKLASLLDLGPYKSLSIGQRPKYGVSASAFDVLSATAQLANGTNQVAADLSLNIPGIASASLKLAIGERPQGKSWIAVGTEGISVHTAQTRLLLTAQLAGNGDVALIKLPLYFELASATARLTALQCGFPNVSTSTVTLGVTPGVIDAWLGDVSDSEFSNFGIAPNPPAAPLAEVSGIKVNGRSHVTVSNLSATPVTFSYADIEQKTKKTVGTTNFTASLLSRLMGDTEFTASLFGLTIRAPVAAGAVSALLAASVTPLDALLTTVLNTLGIGLGQADVWVLGLRCDGAVLVL